MTDIKNQVKQLNDQSRLVYLCENNLPFTEFRKFVLKEINNTLEDYRTSLLKEIKGLKKEEPPHAGYSAVEAATYSYISGFNAGLDKASEIIRKHN